MTARFVGPTNSYLPVPTGQVIAYMRDPKAFKLNKYVQYVPTDTQVGLYAKLQPDDQVRMKEDGDYIWQDSQDRPDGEWQGCRFEWVEFTTQRRSYPMRVGFMARDQARRSGAIDPVVTESQMCMQQAMINRTRRVITLLETDANWLGNVDTAVNLNDGAGTWDLASDTPGDPAYNAIKRSLLRACKRVHLATNGVVQPKDLVLLISPGLAEVMSSTAEIHNYLKYGPFSKSQLEDANNSNADWGLPPTLYGHELVIEDAVFVNERPAAAGTEATTNRQYVKSDTSAILVSRKGGINGTPGARAFSTVQMYFYGGMEAAVETKEDSWHRRVDGSVVDNFAEVLAATRAGYKISSVLS